MAFVSTIEERHYFHLNRYIGGDANIKEWIYVTTDGIDTVTTAGYFTTWRGPLPSPGDVVRIYEVVDRDDLTSTTAVHTIAVVEWNVSYFNTAIPGDITENSQEQAEAGVSSQVGMSPRRTKDAIDAQVPALSEIVENTQNEAEAGTASTGRMTPRRVANAIEGYAFASTGEEADQTLPARLAHTGLTPHAFMEGVGLGVAETDTDAFNAVITYGNGLSRKNLFIPAGEYLIGETLESFTGSNWNVSGAGMFATQLRLTADVPIFDIDITAASSFFGRVSDMTLRKSSGGAYSNTVGIHCTAGALVDFGLNYWLFERLRFDNLYRGIVIDDTSKIVSGSLTGNARHLGLVFSDLVCAFSTDALFQAVRFNGGSGTSHVFRGGWYRGTDAAISIGTGADDISVGDLVFDGMYVLAADVGVDLIGPGAGVATAYNQNVVVAGCHFDNCTTATVRLTRMSNFRILPNNSTTVVGVVLTSCTQPYWVEDRNALTVNATSKAHSITGSTVTLGGTTLALGSGTTTASVTATNINLTGAVVITDASGIRFAQNSAIRRSTNTDGIVIAGGNATTAGANLELYGGAHATLANWAFLDADHFQLRAQDGTPVFLQTNGTTGAMGFYGVTPVVRPTVGAALSEGGAETNTNLATRINQIRTALVNLGLCQ